VIAGHDERLKEGRILDDPGMAPELDAARLRVIEEEQADPVVLGEIAHGQELLIPREIGESQAVLVEHFEEPLGAAAMLEMRPARGVGRCDEEAVALGDEGDELGRQRVAHIGACFEARRMLARAIAALRLLDRIGESELGESAGHRRLSFA
jgi:hypothetical protein